MSNFKSIDPKIISSPDYDISFFGAENLHPFDTRKYGRAWHLLRSRYGDEIYNRRVKPIKEVDERDLLLVHTQDYLESLKDSGTIARALELPMLSNTPYHVMRSRLVRPMRLATQGTIMTAYEALKGQIAVNLSGGYHHASEARGEGFCLFADVPVAIQKLRQTGLIQPNQQAIIIDLDAHQGNGYARIFQGQSGVFIFDMYNQSIWPRDEPAKARIDYSIGINSGCNSTSYLDLLYHKLPEALDRVPNPAIAFYIAGTDIIAEDALGNLKVTEEASHQRDNFVIDTLVSREIPLAVVLGGGYSRISYRMIADMVGYIIEEFGDKAQQTTEQHA